MFTKIYCQDLFLLFFLAAIFVIAYAVFNVVFKNLKILRAIGFVGVTISLLGILYFTVFNREVATYNIELRPFYGFVMAKMQPESYRMLFMNSLLYVPFGIFLPYLLSSKYKRLNVAVTVLISFAISTIIEGLQYLCSIGVCETDDVIFNTFGGFVGALGYLVFGHLKRSIKMKNNLTESQNILCDLCGNVLFEKNNHIPEDLDVGELFDEAKQQTVFPIAYMGLENGKIEKNFYSYLAKNTQVNYNHAEIADLLSKNNVKYIFIKGVASALYYKESTLRMMGDVDVLINRCDTEKVHTLLQTLGYITNEDIFKENGHIGYKRRIKGVVYLCEVHFALNGIPDSASDIFEKYIGSILDNAKEITVANKKCSVPSDFHHGIILLLHTANHLTNEGVGLRHLCDWAVFANSFSNDEFVNLFEIPLKEMGLWRFAQLLTLCCEEYLGIDKKEWAGEAEDSLIGNIISDIIKGGNFGSKDKERYGQIKYIFDREAHKVSDKGAFFQLLSNINSKAKTEYNFAENCKLLLPITWVLVIFNYFILLLTRKRNLDNLNTIISGRHRQNLYNEFKLFEKSE